MYSDFPNTSCTFMCVVMRFSSYAQSSRFLSQTCKERKYLERKHGVRYTGLATLPYYDTVRFCMVDLMHN